LIHIGKPIKIDISKFFAQLEDLAEYSEKNSSRIAAVISEIVPTYHVSKELRGRYDGEIVEYPAKRKEESKTLA
jgi:hypothetical protein